jgi:hypothetical protein
MALNWKICLAHIWSDPCRPRPLRHHHRHPFRLTRDGPPSRVSGLSLQKSRLKPPRRNTSLRKSTDSLGASKTWVTRRRSRLPPPQKLRARSRRVSLAPSTKKRTRCRHLCCPPMWALRLNLRRQLRTTPRSCLGQGLASFLKKKSRKMCLSARKTRVGSSLRLRYRPPSHRPRRRLQHASPFRSAKSQVRTTMIVRSRSQLHRSFRESLPHRLRHRRSLAQLYLSASRAPQSPLRRALRHHRLRPHLPGTAHAHHSFHTQFQPPKPSPARQRSSRNRRRKCAYLFLLRVRDISGAGACCSGLFSCSERRSIRCPAEPVEFDAVLVVTCRQQYRF